MSATLDAFDATDAWVDAMADPGGGGPYRQAPPVARVPYTRTLRALQRAEQRLAPAERAFRRMTSPYLQHLPEHQDLANTSRIAREYQEARREVERLRARLRLAILALQPRLEQLRRRNPNWPRPMSLWQRLRWRLRRR